MSDASPRARFVEQTPRGRAGALAAILLSGDVTWALEVIGAGRVDVGRVGVRDLAGVDRGVVARWSADSAHLMPHGGAAVVRALCSALERAGAQPRHELAALEEYPDARSEVEAQMLRALARAQSPAAIDLLLDQPRRWAKEGAASDPEMDRFRNRLIEPALVVAVGAPNIGKSTLVNALAGRGVSITADEPGTTRDYVGVMIDLGGVVVRYVDAPGVWNAGAGLREEGAERAANGPRLDAAGESDIDAQTQEAALEVARRADLVVMCGDPRTRPPCVDGLAGERIVVCLRADLGEPGFACDARVSVKEGWGVRELAGLVRERVVPRRAMEDGGAWGFWQIDKLSNSP